MINIMALLLGGRNAPARQVFRSLNSEDARVRVMRSLLEQASINKDKGKEFDEIIDIFVEIKKKRNAYAHGLWSTHDSGRVFLQETSTDPINSFMSEREVKTGELNAALNRVRELFKKSMPILYPEYFGPDGKFRPSRQMPPPLPIVENQ
jgi:hypothetical protein